MDTTAFLLARQEILSRLEGHRLPEEETRGLSLPDLLKFAIWPVAGLLWFKKTWRLPFALAQFLTGPLSGGLWTAAMAGIKLLR